MPPIAKKAKKPLKNAAPKVTKPTDEPEEKLAISGQLDKKLKKSQARIDRERGVVVIRHLPHGFFEEQLKNYFQQFGKVTRLRLARSKRTGGSKGFAFVEFEFPEVAKVAAETMDNYLMFQRVVKAAYIPPENQQYNYFKSSVRRVTNKVGKPIYVSGRTACIQRKAIEHNNWTNEAYQKRIASNLRKLEKLKKKYEHLGIDFDNFTVKPNIQTATEKEEQDKKKTEEKPAPGSLLLIKKRKQPNEKVEKEVKKSKIEKPVKVQKKIELKDLLQNTLNEEDSSEDEEFIPMREDEDEDEDDNIETSDEESYGILKELDSDNDEKGRKNVDEEDSEEEETSPQPKRKGKSFEKSTKVDRMAELIKRKPQLGGIQKCSKKNLKDKSKFSKPSGVKNALKLAAVKEIKQQGKMKQLKKADLKKINKKQKV